MDRYGRIFIFERKILRASILRMDILLKVSSAMRWMGKPTYTDGDFAKGLLSREHAEHPSQSGGKRLTRLTLL